MLLICIRQFRFISVWSHGGQGHSPSWLHLSLPGICRLLQPLFTRSWATAHSFLSLYYRHIWFQFATKLSFQFRAWHSSRPGGLAPQLVAWTLQVSWQWPIKCPCSSALQPRLPSGRRQCGVSHCDLSSCLELIILELLERLSDFKSRLALYPYLAISAVLFFSEQSSQFSVGTFGGRWLILELFGDPFVGPSPLIFWVICLQTWNIWLLFCY